MAKYRSRPKIVEANQFTDPFVGVPGLFAADGATWCVTIHGGKTPVVLGDWLIQESDGVHWYPCKPEEFAKFYDPEPVKEGE